MNFCKGLKPSLRMMDIKRRVFMSKLPTALVKECQGKLVQARMDLLNRQKDSRKDLTNDDKGGDEADQTVRVLQEAEFLSMQERIRNQLSEIDQALARIEAGTFGVCEETEEPIEHERLRAIPWTRLSIEGAELRESVNRRYARGG
jgi:DnaK suppressor protein